MANTTFLNIPAFFGLDLDSAMFLLTIYDLRFTVLLLHIKGSQEDLEDPDGTGSGGISDIKPPRSSGGNINLDNPGLTFFYVIGSWSWQIKVGISGTSRG